jgi:predicted O-methyltransferase YrrM
MDDIIVYPAIESFLRRTLKPLEGFLRTMEENARTLHIPVAFPESLSFLRVMIMIHKPLRILEVGTAIGLSASVMCLAGNERCKVDTIEIDDEMADMAEKNIRFLGLSERIHVIRGDAQEVLECLTTPYDFVFLDAAKGQYMDYFVQCDRLLQSGGVLLSDNVLYKGLVASEEDVGHKHRTIAVRLKEYLQMLCSHEAYETTLLSVGDGLALSIKK